MPAYYHNETLFSEIYLEEITRQTESADVIASLKVLGEYREYADTHSLKVWKESYVHEVLSALGFFAQSKSDPLTFLYPMGSSAVKPLSLCYAILPEENLDNTTVGRNWAEKIIRALRENNLQWGLLTNGRQWRIYHQDEPTPYETYLEIDLEAILVDKAKEAYQIFHKFMKAENFAVQEDGKCQFDRFKKESQDKIDYIEKELANALKQREEGGKGVLSDLCMGYVEELRRRNEGNLDDDSLHKKIYHGAMLYMFRLLFLFYADARGLLSDENHALLAKVEGACRARHDGNGSNAHKLPIWDSLEQIFVDIDQTYNGGLFSPQESEFTRFLSETRIGDAYLVNVVFNLTTYQEKNGQEKPISYRDMSVRHLGTLYEGLLEHKLFIAAEDTEVKVAKGKIQFIPASQGGKRIVGRYIKAGEVYFAGDPSERKSTGSYYTPEYIVDYIVRNTVGEKLKELKQAFLAEQHASLEAYRRAVDEDERRALSRLLEENALAFVRERVLALSVLDPAMGSGHFLVNAANLISNFITEILNELGITSDWESGTGYWRRRVVENCIYGVDLNPLAVELAKLSLWILSMAKNQPLSFLNHHLKCGNSLVGARLEEIGNYPFSTAKKEPRQLNLFERDPDFKAAVEAVISKSRQIAGKASSSLDDVREKKVWLEEIERILEGYKSICDMHTSLYFGNNVEESQYTRIIQQKDFNLARMANSSNQYFHWELEFPEVFLGSKNSNHGNICGFDAVIGNPPWGSKLTTPEKSFLKESYEEIDSSTPNSFAYFLGLAIKVSKDRIAYVLPDSILLKDFEKTRYLINDYISEINWLENSGMPDDLKPFADVDHDVCVISTQKKRIQLLRYILSTFDRSTRLIKQHQYVQDKRKIVRKEFSYAFNLIAREKDLEILEKINQYDEMNSFLQCHEGIHTGNSRELLFVRGQNNNTTYRLFYGGGAGDIIENYHSRTSGWFVDYREKLIDKSKGYYASLRDKRIFCLPKIYITRTGNPFKAFIDLDSIYASNNFFSLQFKDYSENTSENLKIILPFIISNLAQYYIRTFAAPRLGSTFVETKIVHLLKFRIPMQKIAYARNDIKAKVEEILLIKQKNPNTSTSLIEADLDQIIFELYGLNEEEISIVKSKGLTA